MSLSKQYNRIINLGRFTSLYFMGIFTWYLIVYADNLSTTLCIILSVLSFVAVFLLMIAGRARYCLYESVLK
jgi:hypothetical protein